MSVSRHRDDSHEIFVRASHYSRETFVQVSHNVRANFNQLYFSQLSLEIVLFMWHICRIAHCLRGVGDGFATG